MGRNSSVIAEHVRRGELEAGVVLLPIDDDQLDVRPLVRDEVLYVSADPGGRAAATIERLAAAPLVFYDAESADADPIRRQLAERAQATASACAPASRSSSSTSRCGSSPPASVTPTCPARYTHAPYYPAGLTTAPFSPALYDTFAIITRPARTPLPRRARTARSTRGAHAERRR